MKFPWATGWVLRLARAFSLSTLGLIIVLAAGLLAIAYMPDAGTTRGDYSQLSGSAYIIDGDTVSIAGERIRLSDIDAPELDQTCRNQSGEFWDCGIAARDQLRNISDDASWICEIRTRDQYRRYVATCQIGGRDGNSIDPAQYLARNGMVIGTGDYASDTVLAKAASTGIFGGDYIHPADWRDGRRWQTSAQNPMQNSILDAIMGWFAGFSG